ncbi:hypothetical protein BHE74_00041695 [Ensete ventricosum]|uniref:Uncharacterized protein n=1 Tax=Ensete ventricosum TaxID=4639 RepID=A0A444CE03_ENSVE|nr:hypothetical protein B296_00023249 [Ensete ventricosum]RWV84147.1 hypothetical protein GW17_00054172 [Ensete ventricosum]RWW51915.1 hypothetical protein BHE74_00041695 [Ensete ventricosum]RZS17428.1 hypothetical protein BHM03_00049570 [Ensete ventricosum]
MKQSSSDSRTRKDEIDDKPNRAGSTAGRGRGTKGPVSASGAGGRRHPPREPEHRVSPSNYFSTESFVVLICLTVSLLILPLVLPPLPPPPSMLLLLPIGILVVLMILAFMPSDIRNITSSSL